MERNNCSEMRRIMNLNYLITLATNNVTTPADESQVLWLVLGGLFLIVLLAVVIAVSAVSSAASAAIADDDDTTD